MRKKIFLGAYINVINAQNINCKSIAFHLDKNKYSIKTLVLGNKNLEKLDNVSFIKVSNIGYKISNLYAFVKGVLWADVCYFPKHQSTPKLALKIANLLNKKTFTTIEGNMCDTSKKSMIESFGTLENMKSHFSMIPNVFGITPHLILSSNCGVLINKNPLFLGVDKNNFKNKGVKNQSNIPEIDDNTHSNTVWFDRFPGDGDHIDKKDELFGSFFPIVRFSNKSLRHLTNLLINKEHGYSEGFVPTILNRDGFKLDTIFNNQSKSDHFDINKINIKHKNIQVNWSWI